MKFFTVAPGARRFTSCPAGPLTNGQVFTLAVSATDDVAVTNVTVIGLGPLSFFPNLPDGNARVLSFSVPASAVPAVITLVGANEATFSEPFTLAPITITLLPLNSDTDGDGLPDLYELANGRDPLTNDAGLDPDGDGLTNLQEFRAGTNPRNRDTDGDGIPDGLDPAPLAANRAPETAPSLFTNANGSVTIGLLGTELDGDALTSRLTALPEVGLRFLTGPGGGSVPGVGGGVTNDGTGLVLRMVQRQPVPVPPAALAAAPLVPAMTSAAGRWNVVLEWGGPATGS